MNVYHWVKSMNESELKVRISEHARYISEQVLFERMHDRPSLEGLDGHPEQASAHHDFDGFVLELQDAERDLAAAHKRLSRLRQHFANGAMLPFEDAGRAVAVACGLAAQATAAVHQVSTMVETDHPPHSRALKAQALAVRLAWIELGDTKPRAVRALAKRIIAAVTPRLATPTEKTITNMIDQAKNGK